MLCAATLFLSCSKDKDNDNKGGGNSSFQWDKGKVFVGGAEGNADDKSVATLWIDGKAKSLSDGTQNSQVRDVAVTATKVYAVGEDGNNGVLWTNGVAKVLTAAGSISGQATAVFVSGEDVYVTTKETLAGGVTVKLWKNGVQMYVLSEGKTSATANSILVSGADVYVVGSEINTPLYQAVLWKNGTKTFLTETQASGYAHDIIVFGSDVYIAGTEGNDAVLWKNDKDGKTVLANGTGISAKSLVVCEGQINVVGGMDDKGMLWIKPATGDVTSQEITAFSKINSVATSGLLIYMTGVKVSDSGISTAVLSQNGTMTLLTDGTSIAYANSVCVR